MVFAGVLALPMILLAAAVQRLAARVLGVPGIGFFAIGASGSPGRRRWLAQASAVPVLYLAPAIAFGLVAAKDRPFGTRVGDAPAGFPAGAAGIQKGDRIVAVNGTPVRRFSEVRPLIVVGKPNAIALERATVEVVPDEKGVLGLMPDHSDVVDPSASDVIGIALVGAPKVWRMTVRKLGEILTPQPVEVVMAGSGQSGWWLAVFAIHLSYALVLAYAAVAVNALLVELRSSGRRTAAG